MLSIQDLRRFAARIKAAFSGRPVITNHIEAIKKEPTSKLHIPQQPPQKVHSRSLSASEYIID